MAVHLSSNISSLPSPSLNSLPNSLPTGLAFPQFYTHIPAASTTTTITTPGTTNGVHGGELQQGGVHLAGTTSGGVQVAGTSLSLSSAKGPNSTLPLSFSTRSDSRNGSITQTTDGISQTTGTSLLMGDNASTGSKATTSSSIVPPFRTSSSRLLRSPLRLNGLSPAQLGIGLSSSPAPVVTTLSRGLSSPEPVLLTRGLTTTTPAPPGSTSTLQPAVSVPGTTPIIPVTAGAVMSQGLASTASTKTNAHKPGERAPGPGTPTTPSLRGERNGTPQKILVANPLTVPPEREPIMVEKLVVRGNKLSSVLENTVLEKPLTRHESGFTTAPSDQIQSSRDMESSHANLSLNSDKEPQNAALDNDLEKGKETLYRCSLCGDLVFQKQLEEHILVCPEEKGKTNQVNSTDFKDDAEEDKDSIDDSDELDSATMVVTQPSASARSPKIAWGAKNDDDDDASPTSVGSAAARNEAATEAAAAALASPKSSRKENPGESRKEQKESKGTHMSSFESTARRLLPVAPGLSTTTKAGSASTTKDTTKAGGKVSNTLTASGTTTATSDSHPVLPVSGEESQAVDISFSSSTHFVVDNTVLTAPKTSRIRLTDMIVEPEEAFEEGEKKVGREKDGLGVTQAQKTQVLEASKLGRPLTSMRNRRLSDGSNASNTQKKVQVSSSTTTTAATNPTTTTTMIDNPNGTHKILDLEETQPKLPDTPVESPPDSPINSPGSLRHTNGGARKVVLAGGASSGLGGSKSNSYTPPVSSSSSKKKESNPNPKAANAAQAALAAATKPRRVKHLPARAKSEEPPIKKWSGYAIISSHTQATQMRKMQKVNQLAILALEKQDEECTFRPNLCRSSARMIRNRVGFEESMKRHEKQKKLNLDEIRDQAYSEATHKPIISSMAKNMKESPNQVQVYDRLYTVKTPRKEEPAPSFQPSLCSSSAMNMVSREQPTSTLLYTDAMERRGRKQQALAEVEAEAKKTKNNILPKSRKYYWTLLQKQIKAAFDTASSSSREDGRLFLIYKDLEEFLVLMGCLSAGDRGMERQVRLKKSLWHHLDPQKKGKVDIITVTVFFHLLMGCIDNVPNDGGEGNAHTEGSLRCLEAIREEEEDKDTAALEADIDELMKRFDAKRIRQEFHTLYSNRSHFAKHKNMEKPVEWRLGKEDSSVFSQPSVSQKIFQNNAHKKMKFLAGDENMSHVDLLNSYREQHEERVRRIRMEREMEEDKSCPFKPDTFLTNNYSQNHGLGDAEASRPRKPHDDLFEQAKLRAIKQLALQEQHALKEAKIEMEGCSFTPDTRKSEKTYQVVKKTTRQIPRGYDISTSRMRNAWSERKEREACENPQGGVRKNYAHIAKTAKPFRLATNSRAKSAGTARDDKESGPKPVPRAKSAAKQQAKQQKPPSAASGARNSTAPTPKKTPRTTTTSVDRGDTSVVGLTEPLPSRGRQLGEALPKRHASMPPADLNGNSLMKEAVKDVAKESAARKTAVPELMPSEKESASRLEEAPVDDEILLFVDVNISPERTERLIVRKNEKVEDAAKKFADEHNLSAHLSSKLQYLLRQQMEILCRKTEER